jgi:hypothetical protein
VVSPNGMRIVYVAPGPGGTNQLWVRSLDSLDAKPLAGVDPGVREFFSPDSRLIAFVTQGRGLGPGEKRAWPSLKRVCRYGVGEESSCILPSVVIGSFQMSKPVSGPLSPVRSQCPSLDQSRGIDCGVGRRTTTWAPPIPLAGMLRRSLPSRRCTNKMVLPSGDQTGCVLTRASLVSRLGTPRCVSSNQRSVSPPE